MLPPPTLSPSLAPRDTLVPEDEVATLEDLDNADAGLDELHAMKLKELSWSPATEPHRSALLHKPAGGG